MNRFGQPIGTPLPGWTPPPVPPRTALVGRWCRLEPLDPARHGDALASALAVENDGPQWTYLPYGPFADRAAHHAWLEGMSRGADPLFFTIITPEGGAVGLASWLRITPAIGSIEVGHLHYAPALQRATAATEAMYLMLRAAFALGYRRYEWKCDALNAPSRQAAQRLGLSFEGVFRQAMVYKGRSRDTAWYAATDQDWPRLRDAFETWLDPANFSGGGQRQRLSELTAPLLHRHG